MNKTDNPNYQHEYYLAHKEKKNQQCRENYATNRISRLAKQACYRVGNKDKILVKSQKYSDRMRDFWALAYRELRFKVLDYLGAKCNSCGNTDWRVLQIDHLKANGHEEFHALRAKGVYKRILSLPIEQARQEYQILCANCNIIKKYENGEVHSWLRLKNK